MQAVIAIERLAEEAVAGEPGIGAWAEPPTPSPNVHDPASSRATSNGENLFGFRVLPVCSGHVPESMTRPDFQAARTRSN